MKRSELKALQAIWTQKLRDAGFVDIEYKNGQIRKESNLRFKPEGYKQAIRDRLSWISERYVDQVSDRDEAILEAYCDGRTYQNIAAILDTTVRHVRYVITKAHKAYKQHVDSLRNRK